MEFILPYRAALSPRVHALGGNNSLAFHTWSKYRSVKANRMSPSKNLEQVWVTVYRDIAPTIIFDTYVQEEHVAKGCITLSQRSPNCKLRKSLYLHGAFHSIVASYHSIQTCQKVPLDIYLCPRGNQSKKSVGMMDNGNQLLFYLTNLSISVYLRRPLGK